MWLSISHEQLFVQRLDRGSISGDFSIQLKSDIEVASFEVEALWIYFHAGQQEDSVSMAPIFLNHRTRIVKNVLGSLIAMVIIFVCLKCVKRSKLSLIDRLKKRKEALAEKEEDFDAKDTHSVNLNGISDDSCCFNEKTNKLTCK